ncbi:DUF1474 family protein [Staphylococcus pettenkoferi]|uniref:type II toxin-antitoxin system toxin TscT n=1 Tax=Staphylococcus pettenkoferi TaxID=170573 RepID=UPI0022755114|nr:DUF1474 family protein [Staphylococcus pettenkoferi]MCY1616308.1 DUF1474 family protein [Staphylococcus pettenkoferi]
MNWELRDLFCELDIVKEKINDVVTSFVWFDEEHFTHDPNHKLSLEEIETHGLKYREHRIQNTQVIDLMIMYMKEFNEIMEKIHEIENTSLNGDQTERDA